MKHGRALRVLLATNFSDACSRAGGAVAQLAEVCDVELTVVHVIPAGAPLAAAQSRLESDPVNAAPFDRCRRVLIRADRPSAAVGEFCRQNRFDLVMAPASNRPRLSRLLNGSFRARLLTHCDVPLWTAGTCLPRLDFATPIRSVACLLDPDGDGAAYLRLATAFADRLGVPLRLLHLIPPVDEGTLADALWSKAPLTPAAARHRIHAALAGSSRPDLDVAVGTCGIELRRMVDRVGADLLFVGPAHTARRRWLIRQLDRLKCPAICIDAAGQFTGWSFQDAPRRRPAAVTMHAREIAG